MLQRLTFIIFFLIKIITYEHFDLFSLALEADLQEASISAIYEYSRKLHIQPSILTSDLSFVHYILDSIQYSDEGHLISLELWFRYN